MLATAADVLPRGDGWAYEFKWDGVRALVDVSDRGVRLFSRRGNEITTAYPELVGHAAGAGDALLDGEIVAFVDGRPSFEALQARMHVRAKTEAPPAGRADAGHVRGLRPAAPRRRRTSPAVPTARAAGARWSAGSPSEPSWTLSPSFDDGAATEAAARQHGLEGVVAKRVDLALPARRAHPRLAQAALRAHRRLRGGRLGGAGRVAGHARARSSSP